MPRNGVIDLPAVSSPAILSDYITEGELARQLGVTQRTLRRWNAYGEGPPRTKVGCRILYRRASVTQWLANREQRTKRAA